jgi:hypothetical protein
MRILACGAAVAALLLGAPVALAHQGSPNFLSQIDSVTPPVKGVTVTVLNRDDRLLLQNTSDETVVIEGYSEEPYARVEPDGRVLVNTDSQAYYLNEERDGEVEVPAGVDSKGPPRWEEVSRSGRFEWHDHRMHWMSTGDPEVVKDKDVRTKVFDWKVPLRVDGAPGAISGTLFWTPAPGGGVSWLVVVVSGLLVAASIAVFTVRRRRFHGDADRAEPAEAW